LSRASARSAGPTSATTSSGSPLRLLVVHGDSDAIVPFEVSGRRTPATIPGSALVVVQDAPHGFDVSRAEEFNKNLLDALG
jgi:non-heme chloroperoxidase